MGNNTFFEDQSFQAIDYTGEKLNKAEYENCSFVNCVFSTTDISNLSFTDCVFENCDLSNAKLKNAAFRDVKFKESKLVGLHFQNCSEFLFSVEFTNCQLNLSSFYKRNLKRAKFKNCALHEVDFTEADLMASIFDNCDLAGAIFENTNLQQVDFRTSFNYSIDPELNRIKKAKFSRSEVVGLLNKYNIEIE